MKRFRRAYLEITNACNLSCPFCAPQLRGAQFISTELFSSAVKQIAPIAEETTFHILGEPTLHPSFENFLALCKEEQLKVCLTTNGTLIDQYDPTLVARSVSQLNFSVHSLIQGGILNEHLPKVISFAERFLSLPDAPYINFRFWDLASAQIDIEENPAVPVIREIISALHPSFDLSQLSKINTAQRYKYLKVSDKLYLHFNNIFRWPSMDLEPFQDTGFCHALKNHFGILSDGTVVPCCLDSAGIMALGNLSEITLIEAIDSKEGKRFAESFRQRKLPHELCRRCDYITRFCGRNNQ